MCQHQGYSLTAATRGGTDRDTVTILDGGPAPSVMLGNDVNLCLGDMGSINPVF